MKIISRFLLLLIATSCLLTACNTKFDKKGWNESSDITFPPPLRSAMLKDLTNHHNLVGLTCKQLVNKLGNPDWKDDTTMTYKIEIEYDMIDPEYTKNLQFNYDKDSVIRSFKVIEWED